MILSVCMCLCILSLSISNLKIFGTLVNTNRPILQCWVCLSKRTSTKSVTFYNITLTLTADCSRRKKTIKRFLSHFTGTFLSHECPNQPEMKNWRTGLLWCNSIFLINIPRVHLFHPYGITTLSWQGCLRVPITQRAMPAGTPGRAGRATHAGQVEG